MATNPPIRNESAFFLVPNLSALIPLFLGAYLLTCSWFVLYLLTDIWSGSLVKLAWILPGINLSDGHLQAVQCFSQTAGGAVLGAIILCFRMLHKHAVVLKDFDARYAGSYMIGPWAAGLLGITVFTMLKSGQTFLGDFGAQESLSCYFYLLLGIVTGFSWERVLARIDGAAKQIFGSGCPAEDKDQKKQSRGEE
jgi:hypothetical protein